MAECIFGAGRAVIKVGRGGLALPGFVFQGSPRVSSVRAHAGIFRAVQKNMPLEC